MIKALAATKTGGELKPFEYDPGPLGRTDVEIDVKHCGICHSDLSMLDNAWGMAQYPLVPGHEVVGTVGAVGADVTKFKAGDSVGLGWHAGYCMSCHSCLDGDHNLCGAANSTIVGRHGGFADKVRAEQTSVVALPANVDLESAGPLFCGGITVFNPLVQFDVKATDNVGVIGIGGLGHMALQFLNAWGCKMTAFTSTDAKKQESLELGAHAAINSRDSAAIESVAGQFDLIMSTVNVSLDWNAYLGALRPKGRLHLVGATVEPLDVGAFGLLMGQRSISGSPVGSPATIARMLDFVAHHGIKPKVETFAFDKANDAIARLRSGDARYRVVLSR